MNSKKYEITLPLTEDRIKSWAFAFQFCKTFLNSISPSKVFKAFSVKLASTSENAMQGRNFPLHKQWQVSEG